MRNIIASYSALSGLHDQSNEPLRGATELAERADAKEVVAGYTADQALRAAWLGQFKQSVELAEWR